jgi:flagellum-specific ATP synthase
MGAITDHAQQQQARLFKQHFSRYQRNRDLISVGAYSPGHDPQLDQAVQLFPHLEHFLQQQIEERADVAEAKQSLSAIVGGGR